ncbi:hypothetical protein [Streptococcus suis]|uniref:hypothetical protein n=2 Tax=Streptococcus suis TaxID=1307 RepID=UPI003B9F0C0A
MVKKGLQVSERDLMILKILYQLPWAMDWQIAVLIGEPVKYVFGRLNQLARGGLVERKKLLADEEVLNYLTAEGCRVLGVEVKKKRVPKVGRFEHDKGVIDSYIWLCLKGLLFGRIVTEKAMNSAIEMKQVGDKWVRLGRDIHLPDGYYKSNNGRYVALEFERTKKNKTSNRQMIANVQANSRRFHQQFWFVALDSIEKELQKSSAYKKSELKIFRIEAIRADLADYVEQLPMILSEKSGIKPKILFSEPVQVVPVAKIPILGAKSSFTSSHVTQSKPTSSHVTQSKPTSSHVTQSKPTSSHVTQSKPTSSHVTQSKPLVRKRFES